ncbi:uncharacterized protein EV420DRAFT_764713 [Desarmillaria tabescens]|uniref:Uncharacterized protein n=1 Tax=Armillaria tabescens TaxID=1929756 RepID=A0AA39JVW5_ARMTA|nr:uncharacterized protein EV420DRAFT_764713 [Desarmillaria tabescens]KAK0449789.1 hypothetical protein EV420DRAFT_764713 [Desarmillaria tabescens]
MSQYTRVPRTVNQDYYNFDAATEETRSTKQGETADDAEIELLIRSVIPFTSQDPPRPSNRRGRAPDSLIFGEPEETTKDTSHSPSEESPYDLSTVLSILDAQLLEENEEEDEDLEFVPLYIPEDSTLNPSFPLQDTQRKPPSHTSTVRSNDIPISQPTPQAASVPVSQSNDYSPPTQPSPPVVVHDATQQTLFDTEMEPSHPPPNRSFNESSSEHVQFVSPSPWHATIMPHSPSTFQSSPQPPSLQPSGSELSLGELQRHLAEAVIQAVTSNPEFARRSMDIRHADQLVPQLVYSMLEQYPELWEIQKLLSVQLSDVQALAAQVVAQFLAMLELLRSQNQQQVHQLAANDTPMTDSARSYEDNSPGLGASPEGWPESAVEQEQECQQYFASDFQFMKLKDKLPSVPDVSEVPAFVQFFRDTYPLLEDEAIWKIVMWFHPELHGQKTLHDTFVLREDAVRAALAEVRNWRFPGSDAGWSISAHEFFPSSQGNVLPQGVLFVEQESCIDSAPSSPSAPSTPRKESLPLGEMFQEHQDIHMEDHEEVRDNWDAWSFDPEPKWSEIYIPLHDPETRGYSTGQSVPLEHSYCDSPYDYHFDYPWPHYEQPHAQYEMPQVQYEYPHFQYEQLHTQSNQPPVQQKSEWHEHYAPSEPSQTETSYVRRDQQHDRQSHGLAHRLRRMLTSYIRKKPTETAAESHRAQRPDRLLQQPSSPPKPTPKNWRDSQAERYSSINTVAPELIYDLERESPQNPYQFQDEPNCHLEPEPPFDLDREPPEDRRYPQGYPHCRPAGDPSDSDSTDSEEDHTDQESDNPPLPAAPSTDYLHQYVPWSALTL